MTRNWQYCVYLLFITFWIDCLATEANINVRQSNMHSDCQYVYIFAHGLGSYQKQGLDLFAHYKDHMVISNCWIVDEPLLLFDFPDAKSKEGEYHNKLVNLGQKADIERLESVYNEAIKQFPGKKIILVGISRGAATIINFVASKKPTDIAALILESPYDTLKSIVIHLVKRFHFHWLPYARHLGFKIAQKHFPLLDLNGIFPIQVISKLPHEIPIIFVHSRKDKVVPINSSRKLYVKLCLAGHKNVYLLELKNAAHGKLMLSNENQLYQNVVHAFYKKYNIPYDAVAATAGEQALVQPSVQDIMLRISQSRTLEPTDGEGEDPTNNC